MSDLPTAIDEDGSNQSPQSPSATLVKVLPDILVLLRNQTNHDFSHYKTNTMVRRIERRMSAKAILQAKDYLGFLVENPFELDLLFRDLLIGVTGFFRDAEAFAALDDLLPELIQGKCDGDTIRVWSAGCSTGEEAYSLAIAIWEAIEKFNPTLVLRLFATDLNTQAVEVARRGVFTDRIEEQVGEKRLQRFFSATEDGGYRVQKFLREQLIFAPQDLIADPPFLNLDLISCRNVLIYLDGEMQKKLIPIFQYALKPGGVLLLGNSESIGTFHGVFDSVDNKWKIFKRKLAVPVKLPLLNKTLSISPSREMIETTLSDLPAETSPSTNLLRLLERRLLRSYAPPTVISSDRGEIVYVHGSTGAYLEPAEGGPSTNLIEMAREGLRPTLTVMMRRVSASGGEMIQRGIRITDAEHEDAADVIVRKISEPESIRGLLMISFEKTTRSVIPEASKQTPAGRTSELELELQFTKESLQTTIEELQTSNEEAKSNNEELQSTNEELQSTIEELETSKEEMQSLNEELQTVNSELQTKVEDLAQVNDDMTNLLNNSHIATVFLDDELCIKRFTDATTTVIKIIPTDVGRPIGDLVTNVDYDLVTDAKAVLSTLMTQETEVAANDGRWFRVRLMPYRTSENVISGLVITFVDVTASKLIETQVRVAGDYAQSIVDTVRDPLLVIDDDFEIVSGNIAFYEMFKLPAEGVVGKAIGQAGEGLWDVSALRGLLEKIRSEDSVDDDLRLEARLPDGQLCQFLVNARPLEQVATLPGKILVAMFPLATES